MQNEQNDDCNCGDALPEPGPHPDIGASATVRIHLLPLKRSAGFDLCFLCHYSYSGFSNHGQMSTGCRANDPLHLRVMSADSAWRRSHEGLSFRAGPTASGPCMELHMLRGIGPLRIPTLQREKNQPGSRLALPFASLGRDDARGRASTPMCDFCPSFRASLKGRDPESRLASPFFFLRLLRRKSHPYMKLHPRRPKFSVRSNWPTGQRLSWIKAPNHFR